MKVVTHLVNWPDALTPAQAQAMQHLYEAAQGLPFFFWPEKSDKEAALKGRNSAKVKKQCGLQSVWNVWLDQELRKRGFYPEVPFRPAEVADNQRVDHGFRAEEGKTVIVENEFGNSAHADSNMLKFVDSLAWGHASLCVMLCPTRRLAAVTTGGSVTYEQAVQRVSRLHPSVLQGPVAILGLDYADTEAVDLSCSAIASPSLLSGNSCKRGIWFAVRQHRAGVNLEDIRMPDDLERKLIDEQMSVRKTKKNPVKKNSSRGRKSA